MRRVNFLVAGVQKGGTTALHHFLSKHPEIFMPKCKELHFFDNETIDWKARFPYSQYEAHFATAQDWQMAGEATPIYTFWPPAMERIAYYNHNMLLIVLLRHPIERAFSHWRMEIDRGVETLNFSKAIREGRSRVAADTACLGSGLRNFSYVERGIYASQIRRIYACLPKQQVLFCTTEAMQIDFQSVFDQVTDFLHVGRMEIPNVYDVRPLPLGESQHQSLKYNDASHLEQVYASDIAETQTLTGINLDHWGLKKF